MTALAKLKLLEAYTNFVDSLPKEPFPIENAEKIWADVSNTSGRLGDQYHELSLDPNRVSAPLSLERPSRYNEYLDAINTKSTEDLYVLDARALLGIRFFGWTLLHPVSPCGEVSSPSGLMIYPPQEMASIFHQLACGSSFQEIKELGSGTYGRAYLASLGSSLVVIKEAKQGKEEDLQKEALVYLRLSHENIIKLLSFASEQPGTMTLCLEYANAGSLYSYLNEIAYTKGHCHIIPSTRAKLILGIFRGVTYLHAKGVIHRDLSLRNILIHRSSDDVLIAKIADFGIATDVDYKNSERLFYPAPESWDKTLHSPKLDVFALGLITLFTFVNKYPYPQKSGESEEDYRKRLYTDLYLKNVGHFPIPTGEEWDREDPKQMLRGIIATSLESKPSLRPDAKTLASTLEEIFERTLHLENKSKHIQTSVLS